MKIYKIEEIFKLAINLEERGQKFYEASADYADKKTIKDIFSNLAKAEVKHAKTFFKLYQVYSKKESTFSADERFEELMDTFLRELVFPDISEVRDSLFKKDKNNLITIIKIAMEIELNTIIFYQRIRELIRPTPVKEILGKIIKEEEKHLIDLKNSRLEIDQLYAGIKYGKFF
ncbi:MAG: ferritin family protein [Candidatus Omnitrophica bacterium]|jgi:rubrerythrin|nr:ferritin family protein [Candidatus Omnitrophota bacterium]